MSKLSSAVDAVVDAVGDYATALEGLSEALSNLDEAPAADPEVRRLVHELVEMEPDLGAPEQLRSTAEQLQNMLGDDEDDD